MTTHSVCQPGRPSPHGDSHEGSSGLRLLPEGEVDRLPLLFVQGLDPRPGPQRVDRLAGERAVVGHGLGGEVDAVAGLVGRALVHEPLDQRDHLLHVAGGVGALVGALDVDRVHAPEPHRLAALDDLLPRTVLVLGRLDDLVVDVGDVRHERDVVPQPGEVPAEDVVGERVAAVTEVRRPVDGGPAHVDRHLAPVPQLESGTTSPFAVSNSRSIAHATDRPADARNSLGSAGQAPATPTTTTSPSTDRSYSSTPDVTFASSAPTRRRSCSGRCGRRRGRPRRLARGGACGSRRSAPTGSPPVSRPWRRRGPLRPAGCR